MRYFIAALVVVGCAFASTNTGVYATGEFECPAETIVGAPGFSETNYVGADSFTTDGAGGADTTDDIYFMREGYEPERTIYIEPAEPPEPSWWSRQWPYIIAIMIGLYVAALVLIWLVTRDGEPEFKLVPLAVGESGGEIIVASRSALPGNIKYEHDGTCAYCGRVYEGYSCPGCGAPRMEA